MILEPIGRDEARELARRELEKPIYHRDRPSWLERAWDRFADWLRELFQRTADPNAHGNGAGWISWVVIILVLVAAVALVAWVMRDRRNVRSDRDPLLEDTPSTARDHRAEADRLAAAGSWPEAIRERLRALARDLEERAVLAPRPGRTADELAAEAGAALPELAEELRAGVRIFDDVWYGDRPGSAEAYAQVKTLDERVTAARPKVTAETGESVESADAADSTNAAAPVPAGAWVVPDRPGDDTDGGLRW
ncbi:DUF4129 domain-containing protein [Actinomadura kijaniata]|uniref:Protein-glutamine gamma-glutamyltransferase-like C-terminal domain-containing protein n=1 Tax=Actinomadura namibiensis TaxID=182080 RepID=A0A7W3LUX4_ACTNM|nr:DUF4129 domain-containing protein [Actinomadura namibiensis]MBA8954726.1 hypothetical protein [Actinomadura namibiensis]